MKMILKLGLAEIQFNCRETSFRQKVKSISETSVFKCVNISSVK